LVCIMFPMKRILGIDYGAKKIGIALGVGDTISPLTVIENGKNKRLRLTAVNNLIKSIESERVEAVVVGIPILDGKESISAKDIRLFMKEVEKKISSSIEIYYVDESKTSKDAVKSAISFGISRKKRKDDHAFSACEILKRWTDECSPK